MKKESDMYEPLRTYFEGLGYGVYAEVTVPFSGGRVDLVAYSYPAAVAVEMKNSLTIDLIDQAVERQNAFPLVYVAIPRRRKSMAPWLWHYLHERGIGIIEVSTDGRVLVKKSARYRKPLMSEHSLFKKHVVWSDILKTEHQSWVPGGHAGGGYVTDYRITMKGVRHYLSQALREDERSATGMVRPDLNGWRSVPQILEHCETHYQTPRNSLGRALLDFESGWVETTKANGKRYYRHKPEELGK